MPKINVYLPDELAAAVREAEVPVSAVCQSALEGAVRSLREVRQAVQERDAVAAGPLTRFTPRARQAVTEAQAAARHHGHTGVGTEHLVLGILAEGGNLALKVLVSMDVEPEDLRRELTASLPPAQAGAGDDVPFTPLAKAALEAATKESLGLGHNYIGCEHLLLGVLALDEGLGGEVLRRMGVDARSTRRAVVAALLGYTHGGSRPPVAPPAAPAVPSATLEEILRRLEAIEQRLAG
ncbi:MAG TPA: Clp protease N-terminal domain-containing protein [Acidimicrobiales bacterium]